jgi:inosine/xanthosine triphosphate pyrophosphatase family protein
MRKENVGSMMIGNIAGKWIYKSRGKSGIGYSRSFGSLFLVYFRFVSF